MLKHFLHILDCLVSPLYEKLLSRKSLRSTRFLVVLKAYITPILGIVEKMA